MFCGGARIGRYNDHEIPTIRCQWRLEAIKDSHGNLRSVDDGAASVLGITQKQKEEDRFWYLRRDCQCVGWSRYMFPLQVLEQGRRMLPRALADSNRTGKYQETL